MAKKNGGVSAPRGDEAKPRGLRRRGLDGIKLQPSNTMANPPSQEEVYRILQWEIRDKAANRGKNFAEKPPTESERLAGLRPYAEAIGQANIEWNAFQESFARFFWLIFDPLNAEAMAVWTTIKSDRTQRDMMIEAAKVKFIARSCRADIVPDAEAERNYEIYDRLHFLYERAKSFEDLRNDAIHSPIRLNVAADYFLVYIDNQNFRGKEFKDKLKKRNANILGELVYLRKSLRVLNKFASAFWAAWARKTELPPIPRMPTRSSASPRQAPRATPRNSTSREKS